MQDQPICRAPDGTPSPRSPEHGVQRQLLLELVTTPPPTGDDMEQLARALGAARREIESAVQSLADAGLVERDRDTVRASVAALRFEALWPIHA